VQQKPNNGNDKIIALALPANRSNNRPTMVAASGSGRTWRVMEGRVRERGEKGEVGGGERSATKPVSSTEPVGIKNNNQPMMLMTVSEGVRTRQAIEQQVREARHEG
jgi:hypothetical protein